MRQPIAPLLCAAGSLLAAASIASAATPAGGFDFNRDIRPILSDKCIQCHGPDSAHREAGLRLDTEEGAKEWAIDTESPADSEVLARIHSDDVDVVMPPPEIHKPLTDAEKQTLQSWIEAGAPWSMAWNYVEPKRTTPPEVNEDGWPANWVDHFVLARLEEEDLPHSAPADPVTLVRRLSFDLTGLPPTAEMVTRYAADPTDAAYERLVDELIASPRYGERMAMYWLDLVRYADTVGYHGDQDQNIWPYRDYVIHAFNSGKPFDEFTVEQLAGDLLEDATIDDKIASAYNRLLQTTHEGGLQLKEYRAIYLADRVRNVSQVWMGATLGCAQCHDHKFDPLPTDEFYSLGAFFADIDDEDHLRNPYGGGLNALPTRRDPQLQVTSVYQRERLERLGAAFAAIDQLDPEQDAGQIATLKRLRDEAAKPAWLMVSNSKEPRTVRVQNRGDWQDESGPIVAPKAPEALGWEWEQDERASRLDLARWLVDGESRSGLLTARVMVNRFWYLMFGEGLAVVLDDFGGQGQPPTHPELLDNLAIEFVESGWDVKHLMKLIATSRTYRQASTTTPRLDEVDPTNKLLARQSRYRLQAEMVRDTALAASGMLDLRLGGPSVKPYQPVGYYANLNFPRRTYRQHNDSRQWRRGLYVHWQRQYLHPMMKAFDAPTREECTARRPRSNTPLASLTLLNDPTFVEAARVLAAGVLKTHDADADRVETLYQRAVSRRPDTFESEAISALVEAQRKHYKANPEEAKKLLGVGLRKASPKDAGELAAWTFAARTVLNLSETLTRN